MDIPQAKLLILTYPVNSGRELVQTIGRVVRIFGDIEPKVLELEKDTNSRMWTNYRRFDSSLSSPNAVRKFIASLDVNKLIELYLEAFPDASYYGNQFLSKFDLNEFDPCDSLNIPTASVCFLNKFEGCTTQLMSDILYWRSNNDGELAKQFDTRFGIRMVVSIAFNKSRFLKNQFFFEPSLEVILFKELSNNVVAVYDSRGRRFNGDKDLKLGGAVSQDKLTGILSLGASATTKEASSKSVSTANRRPESIAIKGKNLEQIVDPQANASYRLATARFDTFDMLQKKLGSYYVGVDSGRISDQKETAFSLSELNDWLEAIAGVIFSPDSTNNSLVDSFAKPVSVDPNLEIESVIFDFSDFDTQIYLSIYGGIYNLDNNYLYAHYNNGVELVSGLEESRVLVTFNDEAPFLNLNTNCQILYSLDNTVEPDKDIVEFLSEHLHKVLLKNGVSFSQEKFYQIKLPIEESFTLANSNFAKVIIGLDQLLDDRLNEKGLKGDVYQVVNQDFSSNSVFYLLDQLKANSLPDPSRSIIGPFSRFIPDADLLLNTDMGTEPADFIISSREKLVYVHVKCGSSTHPRSSAGALAEVGAQAIKNIEMLVSGNELLRPGNWNRLLSPWPTLNATELMHERIRLFEGQRYVANNANERETKLEEVWEVISQRRRSFAVQKEIWIVAANSFSVTHFEQQLSRGSNASSETLQAFQLINSWVSTAHNNDVALKIFTSP